MYKNVKEEPYENIKRYLEKDENDNFIVLYFKQNCNYSEGFKKHRKGISFIINRENNNTKINSGERLIINKNFGVEIHFNKRITNLRRFFNFDFDNNMKYVISIDFSNFDTSSVTDMSFMFYGCSSLESLDLSNFNTSSVTNMYSMFYGCSSLQYINLSNFNTSSVISMYSMFDRLSFCFFSIQYPPPRHRHSVCGPGQISSR